MPHSPIWQALSCARVTLAPHLPQKVREGTEKNLPPFYLFYSVCLCLCVPHKQTHSHHLNYLLRLCISALLCALALHRCAHSLFVCVVFLCKQRLLCACVPIGWVHTGACIHWQMGHREAFYICSRICIATATAARVTCPLFWALSCCALCAHFIFNSFSELLPCTMVNLYCRETLRPWSYLRSLLYIIKKEVYAVDIHKYT